MVGWYAVIFVGDWKMVGKIGGWFILWLCVDVESWKCLVGVAVMD